MNLWKIVARHCDQILHRIWNLMKFVSVAFFRWHWGDVCRASSPWSVELPVLSRPPWWLWSPYLSDGHSVSKHLRYKTNTAGFADAGQHLLDHQDHHYDTMTNMLWKSMNIKTCHNFYWCGYFAAMNSLRRNCWAWATGFSFASLFDIQGEKNPNHRLRGSEWPRCLPCHTVLALWQLVGGYTYTTKIYKNAL